MSEDFGPDFYEESIVLSKATIILKSVPSAVG